MRSFRSIFLSMMLLITCGFIAWRLSTATASPVPRQVAAEFTPVATLYDPTPGDPWTDGHFGAVLVRGELRLGMSTWQKSESVRVVATIYELDRSKSNPHRPFGEFVTVVASDPTSFAPGRDYTEPIDMTIPVPPGLYAVQVELRDANQPNSDFPFWYGSPGEDGIEAGEVAKQNAQVGSLWGSGFWAEVR